eukprot:scaffold221565_cov24-Tisochrysis_lutea.AAC.1
MHACSTRPVASIHTQPEPLPFESLPGSEAAIASAFKHVAGPHAAKQLHSLLRAISRTYYSKAPPQAPAQLGESQSGGEQGAAPLAEAAAPLAEAQAADASKPAAGSEAAAAAAAVTATGGVAASAPGGSGEDVGVEDSAVEQGPHGELSIILEPIADKNARKVWSPAVCVCMCMCACTGFAFQIQTCSCTNANIHAFDDGHSPLGSFL